MKSNSKTLEPRKSGRTMNRMRSATRLLNVIVSNFCRVGRFLVVSTFKFQIQQSNVNSKVLNRSQTRKGCLSEQTNPSAGINRVIIIKSAETGADKNVFYPQVGPQQMLSRESSKLNFKVGSKIENIPAPSDNPHLASVYDRFISENNRTNKTPLDHRSNLYILGAVQGSY